ncbi:hypothetical protein V3851_04370 [Paenibacillus sp. M1]|uniref:Superinfection exclusion protein n=1 Tax=Paenibacillus haidiansis TaxID=1574488 RepID=A0ABU7VQ76_9BACL
MKLRVWWIPQIPMKSFNVDVESVEEAEKILNVLADYDLFQYENRVKGDYANAGGLQYWDEEENEWLEWYCTDAGNDYEGMDINEIMMEKLKSA